jgi:hypothetical protein
MSGVIHCLACGEEHADDCDYTHCNCGASIDENCFNHLPFDSIGTRKVRYRDTGPMKPRKHDIED